MMILALDIGNRRTGVAIADTTTAVPLALDTIHHTSVEELITAVATLIEQRGIDQLVVGMPFLLSGEEGSQADVVRDIGAHLEDMVPVIYVDERHTSENPRDIDPNAAAACKILEIGLKKLV